MRFADGLYLGHLLNITGQPGRVKIISEHLVEFPDPGERHDLEAPLGSCTDDAHYADVSP